MFTRSSFHCVLIILQELHDEPLERKVNEVNPITIDSKTFVRRYLTIINSSFLVLGGRPQLSFKIRFSPLDKFLMHMIGLDLLYDQKSFVYKKNSC